MSWVVESTGEATCSKDYESMHAPVVELMVMEDVALAANYLNPTLTGSDAKSLYEQGTNNRIPSPHLDELVPPPPPAAVWPEEAPSVNPKRCFEEIVLRHKRNK